MRRKNGNLCTKLPWIFFVSTSNVQNNQLNCEAFFYFSLKSVPKRHFFRNCISLIHYIVLKIRRITTTRFNHFASTLISSSNKSCLHPLNNELLQYKLMTKYLLPWSTSGLEKSRKCIRHAFVGIFKGISNNNNLPNALIKCQHHTTNCETQRRSVTIVDFSRLLMGTMAEVMEYA